MAAFQHLATAPTYVSSWLGVAMTVVGIFVALFGAFRFAQQDAALRASRADGTLTKRSATILSLAVVVFGAIVAFDLLRIH